MCVVLHAGAHFVHSNFIDEKMPENEVTGHICAWYVPLGLAGSDKSDLQDQADIVQLEFSGRLNTIPQKLPIYTPKP